jgi:NAD(P)-dependent dehydrogenase (short-subunit alcohol dehydrogenase family)
MDKRVVAVTGVAGGIGRATAAVFRDNGWCVVGVDRRKTDDLNGDVHHFIQADVSAEDAPHMIFEQIASKFGRLDALVNNAACQVCKPVMETSAEDWDTIMACNVRCFCR